MFTFSFFTKTRIRFLYLYDHILGHNAHIRIRAENKNKKRATKQRSANHKYIESNAERTQSTNPR